MKKEVKKFLYMLIWLPVSLYGFGCLFYEYGLPVAVWSFIAWSAFSFLFIKALKID
jgi:hypothetical protein